VKRTTYKKSGVDIKKADEFIADIKGFVSKSAFGPAAFGSLFEIAPLLKEYKEPILVSSTDGVGTKLKIAQELNMHCSVGVDLVAMNVNDIVCMGAKPLFFLDYIACGKVNPQVLKEVVRGIYEGLQQSDCALIGGETAEMPGMYDEDEYDLAGFGVGIVDKAKMVDGKNIREADIIIGLESNGLHSNGFSLVRKVLSFSQIKEYKKELLKPTRIYVKPILSLLGQGSRVKGQVKGIAHITGGAFYSKATKILPSGLGMVIDKKSWKVPRIFELIQSKGNISQKEMYTVFNMGIGMVLVVDRKEATKCLVELKKYCKAYIVGEIVKSKEKMGLR